MAYLYVGLSTHKDNLNYCSQCYCRYSKSILGFFHFIRSHSFTLTLSHSRSISLSFSSLSLSFYLSICVFNSSNSFFPSLPLLFPSPSPSLSDAPNFRRTSSVSGTAWATPARTGVCTTCRWAKGRRRWRRRPFRSPPKRAIGSSCRSVIKVPLLCDYHAIVRRKKGYVYSLQKKSKENKSLIASRIQVDINDYSFSQNIHLVRQWLPQLEKKLEAHADGAHQEYRVFMSAEPASKPENHILPQVSFLLVLFHYDSS